MTKKSSSVLARVPADRLLQHCAERLRCRLWVSCGFRYVAGIAFQILWLSRLALTDGDGGPWVFLFLVVFELSVSPIGGRVAEAVWRGVAGRAGVCAFMINLA